MWKKLNEIFYDCHHHYNNTSKILAQRGKIIQIYVNCSRLNQRRCCYHTESDGSFALISAGKISNKCNPTANKSTISGFSACVCVKASLVQESPLVFWLHLALKKPMNRQKNSRGSNCCVWFLSIGSMLHEEQLFGFLISYSLWISNNTAVSAVFSELQLWRFYQGWVAHRTLSFTLELPHASAIYHIREIRARCFHIGSREWGFFSLLKIYIVSIRSYIAQGNNINIKAIRSQDL